MVPTKDNFCIIRWQSSKDFVDRPKKINGQQLDTPLETAIYRNFFIILHHE